jgi:hypothetical protein
MKYVGIGIGGGFLKKQKIDYGEGTKYSDGDNIPTFIDPAEVHPVYSGQYYKTDHQIYNVWDIHKFS